MPEFKRDVVIGLEVHAELNTATKLFCSCPTKGNEEPNTRTCVTCLGHPGAKPVVNKKAIEYAIKLCLATSCKIAPQLIFSRKSYFYPDLAKNFQTTQYEEPLGTTGKITIPSGKKIGLTRIHMEEDPASLVHPKGMHDSAYVLVDYNRSGNPLVEIVTEPDMASADEARDVMKQLISILDYLDIFDVNESIIKADANISIKEGGYVRQEIKNITGFKEIERAITYEIQRQKNEIEEGRKIEQATRSWDAEKGVTHLLRKKETEDDYGYILDPDLVPITISRGLVGDITKKLPELAQEKAARYIKKLKLKQDDALVIAADKKLASIFEEVVEGIDPLLAAKWLRRELTRVLNYQKKEFHETNLTADHLISLLQLIAAKKITDNVGQKILEKLVEKPFDVAAHVEKEGLQSVSDTTELQKYCKEAIAEQPKAVEDYKKGEANALNFLVGQVMKKTRGKATPNEVNEILKTLLQ